MNIFGGIQQLEFGWCNIDPWDHMNNDCNMLCVGIDIAWDNLGHMTSERFSVPKFSPEPHFL